jgi:hypothetical protein
MVPDDRLDSFASVEVTGCRLVTLNDSASPDTRSPTAKALEARNRNYLSKRRRLRLSRPRCSQALSRKVARMPFPGSQYGPGGSEIAVSIKSGRFDGVKDEYQDEHNEDYAYSE